MNANKLKPCPACGGTNVRQQSLFCGYVACRNSHCAMVGPVHDPDGSKWNALPRGGTASPIAVAPVERLEEIYATVGCLEFANDVLEQLIKEAKGE